MDEFWPFEELELDILSTSKAEIVITGIRESRIGKEIVGLDDIIIIINSYTAGLWGLYDNLMEGMNHGEF